MRLMTQIRNSLLFLTFLFLFLPALAGAADLVNINTADVATLETLPGVGASIAQSIIDNRPYTSVDEVSKANGIGDPGSSSYEKIINLITVGDGQSQTQNTQTQTQDQVSTTSNSQTAVTVGGEMPPFMTAQITLEDGAIVGGGTTFDGNAFDAGGNTLESGVSYLWNFGDGATADGARVQHTYAYPGRYVVELEAAYGDSNALVELTVVPTQPDIGLTLETDGSLTITNNGESDVDVGGWSLTDGAHTFVIPKDTIVLAGGGLRFAPSITGVVGSMSAALLYQNGTHVAGAEPSADSPLRGEQVVAPEKPVSQTPSLPPAQTQNTDEQPDLSSAAAQSVPVESDPLPLWLSLGGLLMVLLLGAGGVWYAQMYQKTAAPNAAETSPSAEEFEIE